MSSALLPMAVIGDTLRDAVGALALGCAVGALVAQSATAAAVRPELLLAAASLGGVRALSIIATGE